MRILLLVAAFSAAILAQRSMFFGQNRATALPITYITSTHAESAAGSTGNSAAIDTTGASLIVIVGAWYPGVTADLVPADSQSNSWTAGTASTSSTATKCNVWYKYSPTTNASHTFSASGVNTFASIAILVFSNTVGTAIDQQNGGSAESGTTVATGSVTATTDNQVYIAGLDSDGGGTPYSIDASFTKVQEVQTVGGSYQGVGAAYRIMPTPSALNPTWTLNSAGGQMCSKIATFK